MVRRLLLTFALALLAACSSAATDAGPTPATPAESATPTATQTPSSPDGPTPTARSEPPAPVSLMYDPPDAPEADLLDLIRRYRGVEASVLPDDRLYRDEAVGNRVDFLLIEPDGPSTYTATATLRAVGARSLWYVADGIDVSDSEVERAARRFDDEVFPAVFDLFAPGREPPGRITIVVAELAGGFAGYFSSSDTLPSSATALTNERMAVYLAPNGDLAGDALQGTLAHELQHVAHWLVDPSESTWVNEGLSELAARELGLPSLPFFPYLRGPDVSLINWPVEIRQSLPNYAGSSLFAGYLTLRTGEENISRLVANEADSIEGIEGYLAEVLPGVGFEQLFADWLVANLVAADAGPYAGPAGGQLPFPQSSVTGPGTARADVPQFGAWYLRVDSRSPLRASFKGLATTPLIPVPPHSGDYCWWGNGGDNIDATLTRSVDLRRVDSATLAFQSWHAIEDEWDFGYVAVSTDGGQRWEALDATGTSSANPIGAAFGPGFTGVSDGWSESTADLTPFAGREVLLRFEYVTDESLHGPGWCIDEIAVPEVNFHDGAEDNDAGWTSAGFIRAARAGVPQRFLVQIVTGEGDGASVSTVDVRADGTASFVIDEPATVIVSGLSRKARQPAEFTVEFDGSSAAAASIP